MRTRGVKMFVRAIMMTVLCTTIMFPVKVQAASAMWEPFNWENSSMWERANGWSNGGMFNCTWRSSQVGFWDGQMHLTIDNDWGGWPPYKAGELRSKHKFGYGLYEVSMKPAKNVGTVSSFFTYTGPTDGTPWDEIDIEFLGKDTTKVQFNYYTNGVGGHEKIVDLGFDAAYGYHTYAFEWMPNYIKWYVDGQLKHTAYSNIPSHPGKIMMNIWPGTGVDEWLGRYDGKTPLTASYDWVRYTPY